MEVFLQNLPPDLGDQGLKDHLTPLLKALNIVDWICHKQRKRKNGNTTFLHAKDGEEFLRQHGEQQTGLFNKKGQPRTIARLRILNMPVYCKQSRNPPDNFLLKSLEKAAYDRHQREAEP